MKPNNIIRTKVLAAMLTIAALMAGQSAWATGNYTVSNNGNTFTITRSGNTTVSETVNYRTVSLSAIEGQHFGAATGTLTFAPNETIKQVTVTEVTPNDPFYNYQNGTERSYRFEVLDQGGYLLASRDRTMTTGYSVPSSEVFSEKSADIYSGNQSLTVTDAGYAQGYKYVLSTKFYEEATQSYLSTIRAELRMTLEFRAREESDGYQYVQILVNNNQTCDTGAKDGDPGTINVSRYMAGFEIDGKGSELYYGYTFPVTSVGNNAGATKPWSSIGNQVGDLVKQKFNSNRASDGKLILPTDFQMLVVRLNASGSDNDDWCARDIKANITAVDATAPIVLKNYKVTGGRHQKGNTIYVSVPFSEIVKVTGTPTLTTTWGTLSYTTGSGSNVLTFTGEISSDATGALSVTSYDGTISDLAGNDFSGSITYDFGTTLDADYAWSANDFTPLSDGSYEIASKHDLRHLAFLVNGGYDDCRRNPFTQTQDVTCDNAYIPIGLTSETNFCGTYDGKGHTISGIDISLQGDYAGIFGRISNATVQNVALANCIFTARDNVGGIAGYSSQSIVRNCRVESNVSINAVQDQSDRHGGIVGYLNNEGVVEGCVSAAAVKEGPDYICNAYGGIAGYMETSTVKNCLYTGNNIQTIGNRGSIVGQISINTGAGTSKFINGYYTSYDLPAIGKEGSKTSFDQAGARRARIVTRPDNVTLSGDVTTYDVSGVTAYNAGTYANYYTLSHTVGTATTYYSGESQTVTLANNVPTGKFSFTVNGSGISGDSFTMPAENVTVGATFTPSSVLTLTARQAPDGNYFATFYCGHSGYAIYGADNICAYTATYANGQLTLHSVGKNIPAETAVIVVANSETVNLTRDNTLTTLDGIDNDLHGVDFRTKTATLGSGAFHVLGKVGDNFGFFEYIGDYMPAAKAYFMLPASAQTPTQGLQMVFDDSTGISEELRVKSEEFATAVWYTLDGRQLSGKPSQRGMYIVNGEKVMIK